MWPAPLYGAIDVGDQLLQQPVRVAKKQMLSRVTRASTAETFVKKRITNEQGCGAERPGSLTCTSRIHNHIHLFSPVGEKIRKEIQQESNSYITKQRDYLRKRVPFSFTLLILKFIPRTPIRR